MKAQSTILSVNNQAIGLTQFKAIPVQQVPQKLPDPLPLCITGFSQ